MARGKPPLGHPRYGGRVKGTPNRRTAAVASKLEEIFAAFDPLMEMKLIVTPAMEAKVTDKLWSLEDMVAVLDVYEGLSN